MQNEDVKIVFEAQQAVELQRLKDLERRVHELEESLKEDEWDALAAGIHPVNREKGFWGPPEMMDKYAAKMMLVVSETVEVVEALRKSQGPDKVTEEFADIFIRALDLFHVLVEAGEADPGLYGILLEKLKVNAARPPKHGNRWG